ncbi:unnamed protein product [Victoria cruziana]
MGSHIDRINIFLLFIGAAFFMPAVDGHRYDSVSIPQAQSCRQAVTSAPAPAFSINQVPSVEKTGSLHLANLFHVSSKYYDPSPRSYGYSPPPTAEYHGPPSPSPLADNYSDSNYHPRTGKKKKAIVIIIVVILIAVIVVVIGGGVFVWRYRLKRENADVKQSGVSAHSGSMQQNQQTPVDDRVLLSAVAQPARSANNTSRAEATFAYASADESAGRVQARVRMPALV